jgi:glucokinase
MNEIAIGIDIGGTFTKYGITDKEGNCLFESSISTTFCDTAEEFVKEFSKTLKADLAKFNTHVLKGIGIGAPNGNYYNGNIEFAPNLKWKGVVPLVALFKQYFDVPVFLTNDANAAAIGEMIFGGAKNMNDFIVITLGTGLGSGIVANGKLIYGHDGFAGELGHTTVEFGGRQCGCGKKGCLEAYASATGIKRTIFSLLSEMNDPSEFRSISFDDVTAEMITKAAERGDAVALRAFEYTGEKLGQKLAEFVAFSSPQAIFLFGGLAKAGDFILEPTRRHMDANVLPIFKGKIKVLISGMKEVNAAVMGSAALAWKEIEG